MATYYDEEGFELEVADDENFYTTYYDEDVFCSEHERFHKVCPLGCYDVHNDEHEYCFAIVKRRMERYANTEPKVKEEKEQFFSVRWYEVLDNHWKFWMHINPNSTAGDNEPDEDQTGWLNW